MRDLNSIIIVGRLTNDAEMKTLSDNTSLAAFCVANSYAKRGADGTWVDECNFFNAELFNPSSKLIEYLSKGKQVAITGVLRQDRWTSPDGQKHSKCKIIINHIQLLGQDTGLTPSTLKNEGNSQNKNEPVTTFNFDEDDIPF